MYRDGYTVSMLAQVTADVMSGGSEAEEGQAWAELSADDMSCGSQAEGQAWAQLSADDMSGGSQPDAWAELSADDMSGVSDAEEGQPAIVVLDAAPAVEDQHGHGMVPITLTKHALHRRGVSKLFQTTRTAVTAAKTAWRRLSWQPSPHHLAEPGLALHPSGPPEAEGLASDVGLAVAPLGPPGPPPAECLAADAGFDPLLEVSPLFVPLCQATQCLEQCSHIMAHVTSHHLGALPEDPAQDQALDHLLHGSTTFASAACEAALAKTSTWLFRRLRTLSAFAMVLVSVRDSLRMLTRAAGEILSAGGKCVTLIEKYKSDETSLLFKVADREQTKVPGMTKALAVSSTVLEATATQSAVTKILQSHRSVAALFETSAGEPFLIEVNLALPLQVMSSTKMEVYFRCFQQTALPLQELAPMFDRQVRLCLSDGDHSVAASFRNIQAMSPSIAQLIRQCDIHNLSNRIDDAVEPPAWQHHVSALIAFAKSLGNANAMRQFREALRLVLAARLQWRQRQPRASNLKRNEFILQLCIDGRSKTDQLRRAIVGMLFNGSWERTDAVEHDCFGPSCCTSRDHCLQRMVGVGVAALTAAAPPKFPRHRWTGSDGAISWPLLLESMHGLLSITYKLYAALQRGGKSLQAVVMQEESRLRHGFGGDEAMEHIEDIGLGDARSDRTSAHMDSGGGADAAHAAPDPAAHGLAADSIEAKRLEQSQDRATALQWVASDPMGMLYVLRLGLHPLIATMDRYLLTAGPQWERKQCMFQAQAQASGSEQRRDYRFCKAAAGAMIGDSISEVVALMGSAAAWEHIPFRFRSSMLRTRATLLLSKVGCGLFRLQCEHKNYPLHAFLALEDPHVWHEMQEERKTCRFDDFTLGFLSYYKDHGGIGCASCSSELAAIAALGELEMASVEAFHASIRRLRHVTSCQTHTEQIEEASSSWLLRRFRTLCAEGAKKGVRQRAASAGSSTVEQKTTETRSSKDRGGPWRAFIREETTGCRGTPDFSDLARAYAQLTAEQKQVLVELGHCARRAAKHKGVGSSAFGLNTREQQRFNQKRAREVQLAQLMEGDDSSAVFAGDRAVRPRFSVRSAVAEVSGKEVAGSSGFTSDSLARLSQQCALDRGVEKVRRDKLQSVIDKYNLEVGNGIIEAFVDMSAAGRRSQEFCAIPHPTLSVLQWRPNSVRERVLKALKVPKQSCVAKELFPLLADRWDELHTSIQSDVQLRKKMLQVKVKHRPCNDAGMCICDAAGMKLCKLRCALDKHIAGFCPPHSRQREQLVRGELVVVFVGRPRGYFVEASDGDDDPVGSSKLGTQLLLGHICDQSLSPWESWFQKSRTDAVFDFDRLRFDREEVRINVGGDFWRRYFWLRELDLQLHWSILIFSVAWKSNMLGSFVPDALYVKCIAGQDTPHVIWNPFSKGKKRNAKPKPWAKTLTEASDSGDDNTGNEDESGSNDGDEGQSLSVSEHEHSDPFEDGDSACDEGDSEACSDGEQHDSDHSAEELLDMVGAHGDVGGGHAAAASSRSSNSSSSSSDSGRSSSEEDESMRDDDCGPGSPPPPPLPPPDDEPHGRRAGVDHIRINEWTTITYFELGPRKDFIAICKYPGHGRCVMTRTAKSSPWPRKAYQGRCLGGIVHWCRMVESRTVLSKAAHATGVLDQATRFSDRQWFERLPNSEFYLGKERPLQEGEDREPVDWS